MANVSRVRVVARDTGDRDRDFRTMFSIFKKACDDYGIKTLAKRYEFYEKPSEKKSRKKREQKLEREKAKRRAASNTRIKR